MRIIPPTTRHLLTDSPAVFWRPTLIYFFAGICWIFFSDLVLNNTVFSLTEYRHFQTLKGLLFVGATTALMGALLRRQQNKIVLAQNEVLSLFRNYPTVVWMSDQTGRRIWFNQYWTEYTGLSLADSQHWGWLEAVHPNDLAMLKDVTNASLMMEQKYKLRYRLRSEDGTYSWFEEHTVHRSNNEHSKSQLVGICLPSQEATSDIRPNDRLDSEGLLRSEAIVQSTISAFVIARSDGDVVDKWALQLSGFEQVVGASITVEQFARGLEEPSIIREYEAVIDSGKGRTFDFITQVNGDARHLGCCISPLSSGSEEQVVIVIRDRTGTIVTERDSLHYLSANKFDLNDLRSLLSGPPDKRNACLLSACAPLLSGRARASIWEDLSGTDTWRQLAGKLPRVSDETQIRNLLATVSEQAEFVGEAPGLLAGLISDQGLSRQALVISGLELLHEVPKGTRELFSSVCLLGKTSQKEA